MEKEFVLSPEALALKELGFDDHKGNSRFFPDLDSALEYCEEKLLDQELPHRHQDYQELSVGAIEFFSGMKEEHLRILEKKMKENAF